MIDAAVSHIVGQLNQYLRRSFDLTEDIAVISNILDQYGNLASNINNKLLAFLVNIEKDAVAHRKPNGNMVGGDQSVISYPPIYLNLYLMFAGNFSGSNYLESLKFISNTISFFQGSPVFDHHNTPDLDKRIDKLVMDIENVDITDLNSLWSVLSGRYMPSILYKVRMVAFDSGDVITRVPSTTTMVSGV